MSVTVDGTAPIARPTSYEDSAAEALDPPRALAQAWHDLPAVVATLPLACRATYSVVEDRVGVATNSAAAFAAIGGIWRRFAHDNCTAGSLYYLVDLGWPDEPTPLARSLYAPCGADFIRSIRSRYLLVLDEDVVYRGDTIATMVDYLQWMIAAHALTRATGYSIYHSAVLSHGERGLLLPAASGGGKTTLAAALVRAGCGYLSDEAALVDPATLRVHAYPKPLSVKKPALLASLLDLPPALAAEAAVQGHVDAAWHLDAERLAPGCVRDATAVHAVVFPRYDADGTTALTPLSRSAAALRLLRCGVNDAACPPHGVAIAIALVARARCYSLTVAALAPAVELLKDVLCS